MSHEQKLEQHFEYNTSLFVRLGATGATKNIHRCVWMPGVKTRAEAAHVVNSLVWDQLLELSEHPAGRVLDLGCGVGATLAYLGRRAPTLALLGITLSPSQATAAAALLGEQGDVRRGSFLALPLEWTELDLAFAIEAFVLAEDPAGFFAQAAGALRAGGRLVIIDDVRAARALSPKEQGLLERFRDGWYAPSVLTVAQITDLARAHGFALAGDLDLSPWVELNRPRDRLIRWTVALGARWMDSNPWLRSLKGGDALQRLLTAGAVEYRCLSFERA